MFHHHVMSPDLAQESSFFHTHAHTHTKLALVDFINDWTECQAPEEKPDNTYWTIHFDGSKQLEGSGAGVVLTSPKGDKFCYVLRLMFPCTNNAAEYEASLDDLFPSRKIPSKGFILFGLHLIFHICKTQKQGKTEIDTWL